MWIRLTKDYVAGIVVGAGLLLLLLAVSAETGILAVDVLKGVGAKFGAFAMILAGGGMKQVCSGKNLWEALNEELQTVYKN